MLTGNNNRFSKDENQTIAQDQTEAGAPSTSIHKFIAELSQ